MNRNENAPKRHRALKVGGKGGYGSRFTTRKNSFTIHIS